MKNYLRYYWFRIGIKAGWITESYCMTHEGGYKYMTEEEREEWDDGGDPCQVVVSVLD
jgi:hypothetical protein